MSNGGFGTELRGAIASMLLSVALLSWNRYAKFLRARQRWTVGRHATEDTFALMSLMACGTSPSVCASRRIRLRISAGNVMSQVPSATSMVCPKAGSRRNARVQQRGFGVQPCFPIPRDLSQHRACSMALFGRSLLRKALASRTLATVTVLVCSRSSNTRGDADGQLLPSVMSGGIS